MLLPDLYISDTGCFLCWSRFLTDRNSSSVCTEGRILSLFDGKELTSVWWNNSVCLVKNNLSLSLWKNNCLPKEEFLRAHAKIFPWARKNKSGP